MQPRREWLQLDNATRLRWLQDKMAQLQEFQMPPNGVVWSGGAADREGDIIFLLWNLVDESSVGAFFETFNSDDVHDYFDLALFRGQLVDSPETIWEPFLRDDED